MKKECLLELIGHLPGAVYQYRQRGSEPGSFDYVSEPVSAILFVTTQEIGEDARQAWRHVLPSDTDLIAAAYAHPSGAQSGLDISFRLASPSGEIRWVRNRASSAVQEDGSVVWYGQLEDITKQVAGREETKRKDSLLRGLFENLPDHIYYKDADGKMMDANPACCRHHHLCREAILGKTDRDLYPGAVGEESWAKEQKLMAGGKPIHERERHVAANGGYVYLDTIKSPLLSKSGRLLGMAGISRDVTLEVENELALEKSRQEAELTAGFIQALFNNLEDQLYYKDAQSRVLGGNVAWVKARGAESVEELIGKTDLDMHPAPLGKQLFEAEQELIASGKARRARERHDRDNGEVQYLESIKCPMHNDAGDVIGLAGISRDITAQVENEQILVEAQRAADSANLAKSMFLAMMSHEIRTPMTGIIGAASLLEGTALNTLQKEFVRTINVSGENLLTLINDILDYSKIEAGKITLEHIPFSLRRCVEDCFDLFARVAGKKNLELLHHIDSTIPEVLVGDPTRLRQVIVNLVGNAVKFTEKGEVALQVDRRPDSGDGDCCRMRFSVRDTGIGIADEAKKNLFKAFTQADASDTRKYGGTGLGLTISLRLVELMGGHVEVDSTLGKGSTFSFELAFPVSAESFDEGERLAITETLSGKRALIVDDNATNRWLLGAQLAEWEMVSEAFEMPAEALDHLEEGHEYDVALIDFQMPVMDGRELADTIQKRFEGKKPLPVVILSSSYESFPNDPSIYAWLSKPVKQESLREQLVRVFAAHSSQPNAGAADTDAQLRNTYALRILVAEDNLVNQRVIKMMIDRLGYQNVTIVSDGEDALAAAMEADYDVILMDIQMPRMNGLDATRRIRSFYKTPDKPWIIALSAGVLDEERKATVAAGMNSFLAKPLVVGRLEEELSGCRDRCRGRQPES